MGAKKTRKNQYLQPINGPGVALFAWNNYIPRDVFYQILDGTKGSFTWKNTIRFIYGKSYRISEVRHLIGSKAI